MLTLPTFRFDRAALPHMKRGDVIINTTSVTAEKGSAGMLDYVRAQASLSNLRPPADVHIRTQSATKGAITTFTKSLALQLAPKAIRVVGVAPGPVFTPLQPASRSEDQMDNWGVGDSGPPSLRVLASPSRSGGRSLELAHAVPLHGRVGQPAELGESYVYLATSNLTTGQIVHPNSG